MEAGWIQDSFMKNDMKIDRAFKALLAQIHEKHVKEDNCRELQLDIYKKDLDNKNCIFRMIVGIEDMGKLKIQVVDAQVKGEGFDFTCESLAFATLQDVTLTQDNITVIKKTFQVPNEPISIKAFAFANPINEQFQLIKINGASPKSILVKVEKDGSLSEIFSFNY